MRWNKVTLIGVGLLGGSLGIALRKRGLASCVTGYVRRAASIEECRNAGAVDEATLDLREAVSGADLLVLCTPLGQMRTLTRDLLPFLKKSTIITDVGSVKGPMVADLEAMVKKVGCHFVGSHPMAGSEKMGVSAAREDLYKNAVCVVTPTRQTNRSALKAVESLWEQVGGRVLRMDPDLHDQLVSRSSHLPHMAAACLARLVLDPKAAEEQRLLCANGFRDTTRIALGSPEMWADIAMANRKHLSAALNKFGREIGNLADLIDAGDRNTLEAFLNRARDLRNDWKKTGPCASPE